MFCARISAILIGLSSLIMQVPAEAGSLEEIFHCEHDAFYVQGNLAGSFQTLKAVGGSSDLELGFDDRAHEATLPVGGAIGFCDVYDSDLLGTFRVRKELEGMWQGRGDYTIYGSDGFNPPEAVKLNVSQWTVMGNIWLDKPIADDLLVYVGGGLGAAGTDLQLPILAATGTSTNFAYQFGTGLTYQLTDGIELDAGYRFLDTGSTSIKLPKGGIHADLFAHQIMFSIRCYLW